MLVCAVLKPFSSFIFYYRKSQLFYADPKEVFPKAYYACYERATTAMDLATFPSRNRISEILLDSKEIRSMGQVVSTATALHNSNGQLV